ncbi:MAG: cytochrome-c peroxidase [Bdellovibrionaceae bacterium]|nr:cytochrome-c peroxidase [Pseudobdellovibrionaceae bacterium]
MKWNLVLASVLVALSSGSALAQEALPEKVPVPADNPSTSEKIELGKQLFFDPRLSAPGNISCNSCHNVMAGGDDNRALSLGFKAQLGGRNSPTVWNAAFQSVQFWDGRAPTLEEQAKGPLINPVEMGMTSHDIIVTDRIAKIPGYQKQFKAVFGGKKPITIDNVVKAIASYERTLITPNSKFDRFIKGDKKAMSAEAAKGLETFKGVGCTTCHMGANFSGPALPMGTGFFQPFPKFENAELEKKYSFKADLGRGQETKKDADKHLYRVPTLRNIALTAPYFHNGKVMTLSEAVRIMGKLQLNKDLSKAEVQSIVVFLTEGLTGEFPQQTMPRLPDLVGTTLITD